MRTLLLIILFINAPLTQAWSLFKTASNNPQAESTTHNRSNPPICLSPVEQSKQNRYRCPEANELYKIGMQWKTDSGWTSHQKSFTKSISHFMGAQWKGIGIGRLYCLYQPADPADFPVQLTIKSLAKRPEYAYWEHAPNQDTLNCISKQNNPCDCQFSLYEEENNEDVDEILMSIKK